VLDDEGKANEETPEHHRTSVLRHAGAVGHASAANVSGEAFVQDNEVSVNSPVHSMRVFFRGSAARSGDTNLTCGWGHAARGRDELGLDLLLGPDGTDTRIRRLRRP
jgi:hypothetical protein